MKAVRRLVLASLALPALLLTFLALSPAPALAAPTWGIEMSHANAYGQQAASCPGGHESVSGEPDCGVDPSTGSGTTFAQESGFNTYTIKVKNTASPTVAAGDTLACQHGVWIRDESTFAYRWLRNGATIAGAEAPEYTLTAEDEGNAIQCQVQGVNASFTTSAATPAVVVSPEPSTAPPAPSTEVKLSGESGTIAVGTPQTCETGCSAGEWSGSPTLSYQWLRNGEAITGATSSSYTPVEADKGTAVQLQVTATNAGGSVVADNRYPYLVEPAPSEESEYPAHPEEGSPALPSAAATSGPMTVAGELPEGLLIRGPAYPPAVSGEGWEEGHCKIVNGGAAFSCTRSDTLAPGESYPPITLRVQVGAKAPVGSPPSGGVTTTVAVSGGGAATVTAGDPTTIAPAVPFGIQSFTTSVTESLGNPFTQAGGPPVAATATFALNSTVSPLGTLETAGGTPKDIETELPPGFIGNPQDAPKCTAAQVQEPSPTNIGCPSSTAVGFATVETVGLIKSGKAEPFQNAALGTYLVYNLEPAPGTPAAFAFSNGAVFVLNAKLRNDGDYGITIGDANGGRLNTGLEALKLTFCSYGVSGHPYESGIASTAACAGPLPGAKPFLTNPTKCTGPAPVTTLRTNTYEQPADYASKTVYAGTSLVEGAPSASESFLTGCDQLHFQPEVQFKSSPASEGGTSQADEPTGATFALKVPQSGAVGLAAGAALSCSPGNWSESPTGYAYQWLSDGKAIAGATSQSYTVTTGDAGSSLQCEVAASDGGVGPGLAVSAPFLVPPAASTAPPTPGTPKVEGLLFDFGGKLFGTGELTCKPGTAWSGEPTFSYQWFLDGAAIPGATASIYTVSESQLPGTFQCEVTGTNAGGAAAAFSANVSSNPGPSPATPSATSPPQVQVPKNDLEIPLSTPELKNATVTLPEGMTIDPSAADGLQACSNAQFGLGSTVEPAEPAACPLASQVGTVKIVTPLLEKPVEGQVFIGQPECSPCSNTDAEAGHIFRLFVQARSAERGVVVKLAGHVSANPVTGRLQATFTQQPQLPFSELLLTFNGGARAPLANPQTCGTFTTSTDLTPWSAPGLGGLSGTEAIAGTPDATPSSSFNVDWNGAGGACPGSLPFSPSFTAGSQTPTAGVSSPFSVTFGREDREQDISAITLTTPPGLLGMVSQVSQCPEAQANAGTCGPESLIGSTTVGAGPGPHPFYLGGRVYLTGPYKGQPFGLSIVVPAVAGPFNLGTVVVRASIAVNPSTAALTITSDPLPQFVDGVQLRLRRINVEVNRPGFMLNPTSCAQQAVGATITAAQGASSTLSTPFEVGGCQNLPFAPKLTASAGGHASKADGASLDVKIESAGVGQANIAKVDLQLPKALPSRLSTLQKACLAAVFNANPAACHEESVIGKATIHTPILKAPLTGPAYLVSHGGAAFPDVEFVLQGEGVTLILDGNTDIKNGITYSRFESAPDAPFTSFETELPTGPHSILGAYVPASANYNLCGTSLALPTIITAQNGKQIKQTTKIAVTGCKASKQSVKITKTKLKGNTLLVTVKTSANGTIRISGSDLKTTTKKNVKAGSHQITVALSKAGKTAKTLRKKTKLRASLTVGKQAVATTISVKL
jgi:hypothetical protein